jgi:hypothetical protein
MHYRFGLFLLLTTAVSLTLIPAVSASGPSASASASCGNVVKYGAYQIKTAKVSCTTAKRTVVPQWNKKCGKKPTRRCTIASGYTCRGKFDGYEGLTIKCTKGTTRRVTWLTT